MGLPVELPLVFIVDKRIGSPLTNRISPRFSNVDDDQIDSIISEPNTEKLDKNYFKAILD